MVVVFGSINVDLVAHVERFPRPGETVAGKSFAIYAGGKGGNQALAASHAGAEVRLYGAVGDDAFAGVALASLAAAGVRLDGVVRHEKPTGCATILVDSRGQNCIVIAAGANAHADPEGVPDDVLGPATTLVVQQEVPELANAALIERARSRGARILLNAAPARSTSLDMLRRLDVLVVNEVEAATLAASLGWVGEGDGFARAATAACPRLTVAVTLGSRGAIVRNGAEKISAAPPRMAVADTTGAGDAFVGALAAALDRGAALRDALARAVAAGTIACTAHGAQASLPDAAAIDALLPQVAIDAD